MSHDEVLKKTADFIREVFQEGVAARLGGDEYALLLDRIMDDQEFSVKEKILQEKVLSLFRRHEPGDLYVTISIGKCSTDGSKDDSNPFNVDQFLHQADDSMYEAKRRHHTEQNRIS
ncbi:MAG: diguanylate cyclase [Butyrivibrio sp.]|nr:diguanylate cyclase [Butyrivibrio sp.]